MPPLTIIIMRHALSQGNREGRMMGHLDDVLTEEGVVQAHALGQALAERALANHQGSPDTPDSGAIISPTLYSSPVQRAWQTAEIVLKQYQSIRQPTGASRYREREGDRPSPPIHPCDDLKEFHNGIFQGLTWVEAQQRYPDLCNQLETTLDWIPIPEAESLEDGRMRARRFIQKLLQRHTNGDVIWVISHEWIMQHLIAELMGGDRTWGITIPHTSLFEFRLDHPRWFTQGQNRWNSQLWRIHRFNDTSHVDESEGVRV